MAVIGYKRVSTVDQNLARQDLGECDRVFEEKKSGKNITERPALQEMLSYARKGDTVVVHSIDRMARDLRDLQDIVQQLNDKGVAITFNAERLTFDPEGSDAMAKLQLQMMGAFAEFERNIIKKRQLEGIAKAKAEGRYVNHGRRATIDRAQVHKLRDEGFSTYKIADKMGISRMSVHRILNQ
ncbi:recombinase family protein [Yoonia sediminilitoris]|uniref:DNA invertase Pin-like site-specific DNA recombinase n=1 Tax=Yoonia sediminilitoris TaxID=1286148 RepID=A0A2T6KRT9_9RHOB|nr:recombinase family protein [Yoonia sediminilitoris]PUB19272.1 DNA invertase Pin-like site-specific DNA recombinase [Yoonia sediminilitoris]RCW99440.1 DNA invertase Pin-like site-specific DNA recombinase [Yoonia sediminilitoris]